MRALTMCWECNRAYEGRYVKWYPLEGLEIQERTRQHRTRRDSEGVAIVHLCTSCYERMTRVPTRVWTSAGWKDEGAERSDVR